MTGAVIKPDIVNPALSGETTTQQAKANFNLTAHGLRGIASFMVFAAHLLGGTAEHIYPQNLYYTSLIQGPWNFGRWGVELFFAISGFVILPSIIRYVPSQFALRRFFRLYPLFFTFTLLFVMLNFAVNSYPKLNDWQTIISGFLFTNLFTGTEQLTPNAWSLTYEVIFYTLACLTFHVAVRQRSLTLFGIMVVAILSFLYFFPIAVYFLFGLIVRLLLDRGIYLPQKYLWPPELLLLAACILFASTQHFGYKQEDLVNPLVLQTMLATGLYFYLAVTPGSITGKLLGNRLFFYLGTVSYSLYLVHPYTYYITRALFQKLGLFTDDWFFSMAMFFLATTPLTLAITHVVHKYVELMPYQWFFRQRIYRKGD